MLYHRGKKPEIASNRLEASCDGAVDTEEKQSLFPSLMFFVFLNTSKFVYIFHLCTALLPLSQQDKKHKSRLISYFFTIPAKISSAKKH